MARDYIFVCRNAIEHLIQFHGYQSAEYDACQPLLDFLIGERDEFNDFVVRSIIIKDGVVLYNGSLDNAGLFFDLTLYNFVENETDIRIISLFQRLLRSASKYFGRQNFVTSELVRDTNLIVFPFPFTSRDKSFRVVLDRNTYRGGKTMNFLTSYYGGYTETTMPFDSRVLSSFYDTYKSYRLPTQTITQQGIAIPSFGVNSFEKHDFFHSFLKFEEWAQYLTRNQSEFIFSPLNGARRLEGAAGTGKTLSLILKCIFHLKESNYSKRFIFITHSRPTKDHIIEVFSETFPELKTYFCTEENPMGALLVTTIQEWCIDYLGTGLSATEYLDKDAQTSKGTQLLYIEEAYSLVHEKLFDSYSNVISTELINFLVNTDKAILLEMLQYEIGVVIKGRAEGDLENYKTISRPHYGIPCMKNEDRQFLFLIYLQYQELLESENQFDSDDIVLTALSSLNAPIWRRRREKEGFDACFLDETHLFNFNELSVIQYLNKADCRNNVIFAIDKSQYAGEVLMRSEDWMIIATENNSEIDQSEYHLSTIFRSSPDVINLAYNIMAVGSTLFDNFDNPLVQTNNSMTFAEEKMLFFPKMIMKKTEQEVISEAIVACDTICGKYDVSRGDVLLITTTNSLLHELTQCFANGKKPFERIEHRGDMAVIQSARQRNKYICSHIDFVGGLEFSYVLILGVDDNNVPPRQERKSISSHFSSYAWHRRMYVALTRAKYGVCLIGNESYGVSPIFENALANQYINKLDKFELL